MLPNRAERADLAIGSANDDARGRGEHASVAASALPFEVVLLR